MGLYYIVLKSSIEAIPEPCRERPPWRSLQKVFGPVGAAIQSLATLATTMLFQIQN